MSISLELPEALEQQLADEASALGVSLAEYIVRLLTLRPTATTPPQTGADLVAYWQAEGLIGTRSDILDSQSHARLLRERAERRYRGE